MNPMDCSEQAWKNGYKTALEDLLKEELIYVETANRLLEKHHIEPFHN